MDVTTCSDEFPRCGVPRHGAWRSTEEILRVDRDRSKLGESERGRILDSLNPRFNLLSSTASGATAIIAGINSYEAELHARSSSELFPDPSLPPHATNKASLSDRRKLSEVASQKIGET